MRPSAESRDAGGRLLHAVVCWEDLGKFPVPLRQLQKTALFLSHVLCRSRRRTVAAKSLSAITQRREEPRGSQVNGPGLSPDDHSDSALAVGESVNVFKL